MQRDSYRAGGGMRKGLRAELQTDPRQRQPTPGTLDVVLFLPVVAH